MEPAAVASEFAIRDSGPHRKRELLFVVLIHSLVHFLLCLVVHEKGE